MLGDCWLEPVGVGWSRLEPVGARRKADGNGGKGEF